MAKTDPATEQVDRPLEPDNWRRIGTLTEPIKAELEAAIRARDEAAAAEAHDDLTAIEHEQRVRETVRKYR